jgi:hypothetical protein
MATAPGSNGASMGQHLASAVAVPVVLVSIGVACAACGGPSDSYSWGERAGNSAVSLVHGGVNLDSACQETIEGGSVFADDPVLNADPPPKNFDMADAQKGCLDQLHKRLGY